MDKRIGSNEDWFLDETCFIGSDHIFPLAGFDQVLSVSAVFVNNPMPEPASLTASAGGFALTLQIVAGVTSFHNAWPGGSGWRGYAEVAAEDNASSVPRCDRWAWHTVCG
jgi:hypothetical protein